MIDFEIGNTCVDNKMIDFLTRFNFEIEATFITSISILLNGMYVCICDSLVFVNIFFVVIPFQSIFLSVYDAILHYCSRLD